MEWILLLVLILCPIMMLFMHRGDKKHNHGDNDGKNHDLGQHHNYSSEVQSLDHYKINQLEGEIEFLKTQNVLLQKKVDSIFNNISLKQ